MDRDCMKTYEVQFILHNGNGWALVNAKNVGAVPSIIKNQSQYRDAKIVGIKELPFMPQNTAIIYEGAVTISKTPYDMARELGYVGTLEEWLKSLGSIDEDSVKSIIEDYSFVTTEELHLELEKYSPTFVPPSINPDTNTWIIDGVDTGVKATGAKGQDGISGRDGLTPYIDPITKNWIIGREDTGVKAEGTRGDSFAFEIVNGHLIVSTNDDALLEIVNKHLIITI